MIYLSILSNDYQSNNIIEDLRSENSSILPLYKGDSVDEFQSSKILSTDVLIISEDFKGDNFHKVINDLKSIKSTLLILKIFNPFCDEKISDWMQMGIDGFVPLGIDIIDLNASIFTLLTKRKFIHPDLSILVFNCFEKNTVVSFEMKNKSKLILQYLSEGKSYKEIAGILNVSIDVVRYNIKEIYKKLGVKNKGGAVGKYKTNAVT